MVVDASGAKSALYVRLLDSTVPEVRSPTIFHLQRACLPRDFAGLKTSFGGPWTATETEVVCKDWQPNLAAGQTEMADRGIQRK